MEMNNIENLSQVNWYTLFIALFVIAFAFVSIVELVEKISVIIGKPVKWMKQRNGDHILLTKMVEEFNNLKEKDEEDYKKIEEEIIELKQNKQKENNRIEKKIDDLAELLKDKSLEDSRWHILDMASAIGTGRIYSTEQLSRALKTYDEYEKLIRSMGKTNGEVEISIEIIKKAYSNAISHNE